MKLNNKTIGLITIGTVVVTNLANTAYVSNIYKNEIESINDNHKKIEEEYKNEINKDEEIILDLKNDIVALKNKDDNKYKKFSHPDEVELSAGYYAVGKDVKPGTYNIVHIEGQGLVTVDDNCWQIGTDKEYGDAEIVENVKLKNGEKIEVTSGLTFRFVPVE